MIIFCENCKKEFSIPPSRKGIRKYCSRKCFKEVAKIEYVCAGCNSKFIDVRGNKERRYCSKDCQTKNKKNLKGIKSHRWNSIKIKCAFCGKEFYKQPSQKHKKYCSAICFASSKAGTYPANLKGKRGTKPRTYQKRGNAFDREWRDAVFKRDNYTCQSCGKKSGRIQAHHIKPYKKYPELRLDLSNGVTLCEDCHKKTDSYGWANYWKNYIAKEGLISSGLDAPIVLRRW